MNSHERALKIKALRKTGPGHLKEGIHKVGEGRFVHRDPKASYDLYERWKGGKQSFKKIGDKSEKK